MAEKLLGRTTPAATVTEPAAVKTPAKTRVAKAAAVAVDEEEEEVVEKPVKRTRVTKVAAVAADDDAEEKPAKKKVVRKKPTA